MPSLPEGDGHDEPGIRGASIVKTDPNPTCHGRGPCWIAGASHLNLVVPIAAPTRPGFASLLEEHRRLRAPPEPPDAERHVRWVRAGGRKSPRLPDGPLERDSPPSPPSLR